MLSSGQDSDREDKSRSKAKVSEAKCTRSKETGGKSKDKSAVFHRKDTKTVMIPRLGEFEEDEDGDYEDDEFEEEHIDLPDSEDADEDGEEDRSRRHVPEGHVESSSKDVQSPSKNYKIEVIRKLLANFDLEETIIKYRSLNKQHLRVSPFDYSSDCASAASRTQKRLQALMGSDIVTLNDYRYMHRLQDKLKQEYEVEMDRREWEREENERQRMRRLMLEGIISPEELAEDSKLYGEMGTDLVTSSVHRTKQKRRGVKKQKVRSRSAGHPSHSKSLGSAPGKHPRPMTSFRSTRSKSALPVSRACTNSPTSVQTQVSRMRDSRRDTLSTDSGISGSQEDIRESPDINPRPSTSKSLSATWRPDENKSISNSQSKSSRFPKYEDPLLDKLKKEETVSGLYNLAESLILPKLQREPDGKSTRPKPTKPKTVRMVLR